MVRCDVHVCVGVCMCVRVMYLLCIHLPVLRCHDQFSKYHADEWWIVFFMVCVFVCCWFKNKTKKKLPFLSTYQRSLFVIVIKPCSFVCFPQMLDII